MFALKREKSLIYRVQIHYVHKTFFLKNLKNVITKNWVKEQDTGIPVASEVPHHFALPDDAMHSANWAITNMAAGSSSASSSSNSDTSQQVDRIALLYPKVDEAETALPRSWSPKDKFTFIGLSQDNLRVHYKGKVNLSILSSFFSSSENPYHCKLKCQKGLIAYFMCYSSALPSQQTRDWRRLPLEKLHKFKICLRFIVKIEALFWWRKLSSCEKFYNRQWCRWHLHFLLFEFPVFLPVSFSRQMILQPVK